jgi:hypothetical protein
VQHGHVTESRGGHTPRLYHRQRLRRTYDWHTSSHFYPDIIDQIQGDSVCDDDVDDNDDISHCGKFYRWESGRHRNSGRRKYPRWTLCVRRFTDSQVAPASSMILETPDIVTADKRQHNDSNQNGSRFISGTARKTKAARTPQYFRRLHFVSSSLNEKICRKESSAGQQFETNRQRSRRLSDSGLQSVQLQAIPDGGSACIRTDGLPKGESQTQVENKLGVVNERGAVAKPKKRSGQLKAGECRQLNKLTSLMNSRSKTRRQFVRKRCRRLIGWDPYGGFGSEQTESTPTSPCGSGGGSADDEEDIAQVRRTEMQEKIDGSLEAGDDNSPARPCATDCILETASADNEDHSDAAAAHPHQSEHDYRRSLDDESSQRHRQDVNTTLVSDGDLSRRETRIDDVLHLNGRVETPSANVDTEHEMHESRNARVSSPRLLEDETKSRERIAETECRSPEHDYDYVLYRISSNLREQTTVEFSMHSPNVRRSLDSVVRKGHRAQERRRQRSCVSSSADDAKVRKMGHTSDSKQNDRPDADGDRLSSNDRSVKNGTFDRFTDQTSNAVNDSTVAVDCQQIGRPVDDHAAADAEKRAIDENFKRSCLAWGTFKGDGCRSKEDFSDKRQTSDFAPFEEEFEIGKSRDDRLEAGAISRWNEELFGRLSISSPVPEWNELPAINCGLSKRRFVEQFIPNDDHQRRNLNLPNFKQGKYKRFNASN